MAPKQKTFELIPDLPGLGHAQQQQPTAAVQSKPPMTTKQAKKLYRQKSKGPKLSKAEQRRIDLMEQDRIRKEFEKEKAQARARLARDKKKAKEEKERDERRRKGLPLVEVHPSQDTISRFINKLGSGAKTNAHLESVLEAESESATEAESETDARHEPSKRREGHPTEDDGERAPEKENEEPTDAFKDPAARPSKRRKLDQPNKNLLDRMIYIPSQRSAGAIARVAQEIEMESWSRPSSIDTDDPDTEVMLEDQLIADVELASSRSATKSSPNRQSPAREPLPSRVQPTSHASAIPKAPSPPLRPQSRPQPPRPQQVRAHQLPVDTRLPLQQLPPTGHGRARQVEDVFKKPASPFIPVGKQGPAIKCAVAAEPSAPPRFKPPPGAAYPQSGRPKFLSKQMRTAPRPIPVQASPTYAGSRRLPANTGEAFPTSTQFLVMNHVDELFPSPSQEARELDEGQELGDTAKVPAGQPSLLQTPSIFTDLPVTDLSVTDQNGRPPAVAHRQASPLLHHQPNREALLDLPFLATQDFILSSQDMEELETPSKVRTDPPSRTSHVTSQGGQLPLPLKDPTLCSDVKKQFISGSQVQAFKGNAGSMVPYKETSSLKLDRRRLLPPSINDIGVRGQPAVEKVKPGVQCPTETLNRPKLQRPQGSSNGHPPSRPSSQNPLSSPERNSRRYDTGQSQSIEGFGRRSPSFKCPHSSARLSPANTTSNSGGTTQRSQNGCAAPGTSPPKKRMFGSSGPGAEVLVAMERSYKQNLAEERRRKEELRAQERKTRAEELAQQELAEIVEDDRLDDETYLEAIHPEDARGLVDGVGSGNRSPAATRLRSPHGVRIDAVGKATGWAAGTTTEIVASQETDYGDFDFEAGAELDMLADIAWADDDLSDI